MLNRFFAGAAIAVAFVTCPAVAAEDAGLARLATCHDSWLDWSKSNPARLDKFGAQFRAAFAHKGNDAFSTPKAETTIAGLRVVQAYPESVGMGVGFSVIVDASFDNTRKIFEKSFGKPLQHCDASDGMHMC